MKYLVNSGYRDAIMKSLNLKYTDRKEGKPTIVLSAQGTYTDGYRGTPGVTMDFHVCSVALVEAPMNNCGIMMATNPNVPDLRFFLGKWWLDVLETYCCYRNRSLMLCSDRVGGAVDSLITEYGTKWVATNPVWNKNYTDKAHTIRLLWKDVSMMPNIKEYFPE